MRMRQCGAFRFKPGEANTYCVKDPHPTTEPHEFMLDDRGWLEEYWRENGRGHLKRCDMTTGHQPRHTATIDDKQSASTPTSTMVLVCNCGFNLLRKL